MYVALKKYIFQVGIDDDGKIQYLNATLVEDVGCSNNENILSYVTEGFPNCYNKESFSVATAAVITDLPSNTYARAPGMSDNYFMLKTLHLSVGLII